MLQDIRKAQKAIYGFASEDIGELSFQWSLDDFLDDEAEVQLHPEVKRWLHDISQRVLKAPTDHMDASKLRVRNWYDEVIRQLETALQVGLMFCCSELLFISLPYRNGNGASW
jgi:hypothetical protein